MGYTAGWECLPTNADLYFISTDDVSVFSLSAGRYRSTANNMVNTDKKLVFVGGLNRSGTFLLHRCIRDHPQVSGFRETNSPKDEGQLLQDVYPTIDELGGPGFFGFDPEAHLDETSQLVNEQSAQSLFSQWREYWDLSKPVLVEKSPQNLVRMRFLQALFPNTHFIVIIRHPIAVSYATKKWIGWRDHFRHMASCSTEEERVPGLVGRFTKMWFELLILIDHWLTCHERFESDKSKIERVLLVKYEDFTQSPRTTLEGVWRFLNVDSFEPSQEIRSGVNQKYFDRWREIKDRSGLVSKLYAKYILSKYEYDVKRFGYSLDV